MVRALKDTPTMKSIMELLPKILSDTTMPNLKHVSATSSELQNQVYKDSFLHKSECLGSAVISSRIETATCKLETN